MIVQPAPIGPRSTPRRLLRVAGLVTPVVLLVAAVALGLFGPRPEPADGDPARPEVALAGTPAANPPTAIPATSPDPAAPAQAAVFPRTLAGLEVHGVRWTVEARNRGLARGVIAVAGYLSLDPPTEVCGDGGAGGGLGTVVPFCTRTAVLAGSPWPAGEQEETSLAPYHLHPQIPPGVRVPFSVASASRVGADAKAVILLARFDDPRAAACVPEGRHCGQELVVERIAWVDGDSYPRSVTVDPAAGTGAISREELRRRAAAARDALPDGGVGLLTALVTRDTLTAMHPEAAALAAPAPIGDAVWYARGLARFGDPGEIHWAVTTAAGDRVLASGVESTSRFPIASTDEGATR
jgi:hypothetical protein